MNHHAYLLLAEDVVNQQLPEEFNSSESELVNQLFVAMGIDAVRSLIDSAYTKSLTHSSKLIVIRANSINAEAQQALLKVLEEPPVTTKFLFLLKPGSQILPTLRSRFFALRVEKEEVGVNKDWSHFLSQPVSAQLELIADKTKNKDNEWLSAIRGGLFAYLDVNKSKLSSDKLKRLLGTAALMSTRGSSNKMLLEDIVLCLKE
jgi:DNA polymerase III delta prime subunit